MKIFPPICAKLNLFLAKKQKPRYLSLGNLKLSSSSTSENEQSELSFCGSEICKYFDKNSLISNDHSMRTIKFILCKLGFGNGYEIELNEFNISRVLNTLYEESSDAALALYFFRWSECCAGLKHTVRTTCEMVHILVSGNMNHRAVELILCLVRNSGKKESCELLLKVLYETHTEKGVLEIVYSMLVNCYIEENLVSLAIHVIFQIKHLEMFPSLGVCNLLLQMLLGSQQFDLAWDLLEEIRVRKRGVDVSIFSLFIHGYCARGDLKSGCKLLMEMKNYGINPDVVVFSIVVDSLCKMSRIEEATSILFKMMQMSIHLDSVVISSVVDGYCKVGKTKEAIKILKAFNIPPNIFIYNSFISKLCTDGNMVEASKTFAEMSKLGFLPDYVSYTTIIGGYCKVRDINKAFSYLGKMLKAGIKPTVVTYTLFINTHCESGEIGMAECLFQKMRDEGLLPDVVTYNTLMGGYGKKGQLHKAFELLDMMTSANISPDIVTYNTLINSLVVRGFINEAKDILDELIRRGFSPDVVTFSNIIDGLSKKENFEEAFLVWFYMSEHNIKPDVVTCTALLNGYCRTHRMEQANALFCKMLDVGLIPDLILYNTLIHGFCGIGNMDDACNLVSMMVEHGILPNVITHRALVLGFDKKKVKNPEQRAAFKMQQIMQRHGIQC